MYVKYIYKLNSLGSDAFFYKDFFSHLNLNIVLCAAQGCIVITDSVIDRLNEEILKLGEGKLSAMQESKEYRSGSLHLRYGSTGVVAYTSGREYRSGSLILR